MIRMMRVRIWMTNCARFTFSAWCDEVEFSYIYIYTHSNHMQPYKTEKPQFSVWLYCSFFLGVTIWYYVDLCLCRYFRLVSHNLLLCLLFIIICYLCVYCLLLSVTYVFNVDRTIQNFNRNLKRMDICRIFRPKTGHYSPEIATVGSQTKHCQPAIFNTS